MKRVANLSAIQRSIRRYSQISAFFLAIALGAPVLTYVLLESLGTTERVAIAGAVAAVGFAAFWQIDAWCQEQALCPSCNQSLFTRFLFEIHLWFMTWVGGIPEACPHCNARLSQD